MSTCLPVHLQLIVIYLPAYIWTVQVYICLPARLNSWTVHLQLFTNKWRNNLRFSLSGGSCKSVLEYLRQHENSILQPPPDHGISEPSDIFHSEAVESHQDRKRRTSSTSDSESANKRTKPGGSLISPPLFQNGAFQRKDGVPHKWSQFPGKLAIVPGCPSSGSGEGSITNSKPENPCNDDEWKNVQVVSFYFSFSFLLII